MTETSSFLRVNCNKKKEGSILEKLLSGKTDWPPRGSEPLNEYAKCNSANDLPSRNL